MLCHVGQFASSKSVMYVLAPELRALISIFRSGGPVISTRLSWRSSGTGATLQPPSRMSFVSGRKSGISPASIRSWKSFLFSRISSTRPPNSRFNFATKETASGVRISAYSSGMEALNSTPSSKVRVFSMIQGSSPSLSTSLLERIL
jgi:hypothetical protein